ncbi:MAG TPA: hypothetical protein VLY63_04675 [Anaerolineae bacterium]|nr:hypothetical protein [Anaerolineae bacterium]
MRRLHLIVVLALVLPLVLSAAGCGSTPTPTMPTPAPTQPPPPTAEVEPTPEPTIDIESRLEDFDPGNFDDPTNIDNPWYPMKPGTQWVYEGSTEDKGFTIPHRIVFTVTDLTKVLEGIETVVAWVEDYSEGLLVESELAFYAQDNDGKVWYMGEYPEEYENGVFVDAPAWLAGYKGARAGIKMQADPQEGMPIYSQGWGPAVNWTDYGRVDQMGQETCVPFNCYEDVLVIAESSLEETDAFQLKYYAPGVGEVRVGWRGKDATKETLELVEVVELSPEALAEVHAAALEQEERAYKISKEVYDQTAPIEMPQEADTSGETSEVDFQDLEDLNPDNFDDPTNIDNEWLPLQPGNQWVYEGVSIEDGEEIPHRIVFTVTDLTKEINGVRTVVAWILDYSEDQLVEAELAFYAQDNDGSVWYLGEYPEEYEDGEFVDAPAWISGVEDARAGIKMQAEPQLGTPSYAQGWAPAVGWTDRAQVYQMGEQTCVPVDCYGDVLVTEEFNMEEPGAFQLKYYARGVGNVRVGWRGEDPTQETLELVEFVQLDSEALAEARAAALALEEHAYEVSEEVYGTTPAAEGP